MAWLGDNLGHGQLLEGPLGVPCRSYGGLDGPFKLSMVCEWMRKHLHLMSCCMHVLLLTDNHVWQILVFPWRTLRGSNEKPASLLGTGLQAHTTPLTPARQSQVQVLWLTRLYSFPLLFQEVSDDIIPSKSFLYYLPLISLFFIFLGRNKNSYSLPPEPTFVARWLGCDILAPSRGKCGTMMVLHYKPTGSQPSSALSRVNIPSLLSEDTI